MPDQSRLWLSEDDVGQLLGLDEAIDVLADAYRLMADGQAGTMRRAHARVGDAILHAVGGTIAGAGIAGTKTWLYAPGGAAPLLVLFSLEHGTVLGIIEAFAMGQLRTAATTGLGTRVLARPDAASMALLGTGKQALMQAKAVASVRPLQIVRVFGRDADRRQQLVERIEHELEISATGHDSVAEAVDGAAIVTAITRAAEPIITGDMLSAGSHVNAVGAIVPSRRELDETAVGRCAVVVADSIEQARDDAGELRAAAAAGLLDWARVRGLEAVVDIPADALRDATEITLFKALGVGLSDVALGAELLRRAHAAGAGRPLPEGAVAPH